MSSNETMAIDKDKADLVLGLPPANTKDGWLGVRLSSSPPPVPA
jgi:hypothetical protein